MFYTFPKASHQLAETNKLHISQQYIQTPTIHAPSDDVVSAAVKHLFPASHIENFELSWDVMAFSKPQCISSV